LKAAQNASTAAIVSVKQQNIKAAAHINTCCRFSPSNYPGYIGSYFLPDGLFLGRQPIKYSRNGNAGYTG
jgi:hypothetical protein